MKKYILLGIIYLMGVSINVNTSQKLSEKQLNRLEIAQGKKAEHQRDLARPPVYKMVDAAIEEIQDVTFDSEGKMTRIDILKVNWPSIFKILDSMRGVISVNEYRTWVSNVPLLWLAVKQKNILAAKTLLEKYKANPNFLQYYSYYEDEELMQAEKTPLMLARDQGDNAMANLLIKYGAQ